MPRRNAFRAIESALKNAQDGRPVEIELIQLSANAKRVGMSNPSARWPDEVVAKARELYASGMGYGTTGRALGVPRSTVQDWIGRCAANAKRVAPAVRTVSRRKA